MESSNTKKENCVCEKKPKKIMSEHSENIELVVIKTQLREENTSEDERLYFDSVRELFFDSLFIYNLV